MKKFLIFLALSPLAALAQRTPAHVLQSQQAAYHQQQFQQQQLMGQIQHNLVHCGDANGHGCWQSGSRPSGGYAQAQQPAAEEIVPAHLRPKWYPVDNFGFIYVGFNPLAAPDIKAPPGAVGNDSLPDADYAARNAQRLCFERGARPHDNCQLLFSYRNMCGSVAAGKLRNGRGERYYPSLAIVHTEEEADAAALAHCRADSAVNPQSCEIRGSVGENCANATKTMR